MEELENHLREIRQELIKEYESSDYARASSIQREIKGVDHALSFIYGLKQVQQIPQPPSKVSTWNVLTLDKEDLVYPEMYANPNMIYGNIKIKYQSQIEEADLVVYNGDDQQIILKSRYLTNY